MSAYHKRQLIGFEKTVDRLLCVVIISASFHIRKTARFMNSYLLKVSQSRSLSQSSNHSIRLPRLEAIGFQVRVEVWAPFAMNLNSNKK